MTYIDKSVDGGLTYIAVEMDDNQFMLQCLLDQFRRYRLSLTEQADIDWNDKDLSRTILQLSTYPGFNESDIYDYSTYYQL
jgi:hypothetical protein